MTTTFPVKFGKFPWLYTVLGMSPKRSKVTVTEKDVRVEMGWAFKAIIPRSSIVSVERNMHRVWGWGVHGWRGKWLVNGSSRNIVRIAIDPSIRARAVLVPVSLKELMVSLDDPVVFMATVFTSEVPAELD